MSPISKSFAGICFISPLSFIILAFKGAKFIKLFKKSLAFARDLSSNNLPNKIKVIITAAPSKYTNLKFSGNKSGAITTVAE